MTSSAGQPSFGVRKPLQERSAQTWDRVLQAGTKLLVEGGWEAMTITAVCNEAKVTPPTIYARVDGLSGLFWAVYGNGMQAVLATQNSFLAAASALPVESLERSSAVVDVVAKTFEEHRPFLQPVIRYASVNEMLLGRGASESRALVQAMADLLPGQDRRSAFEVAQTLYTEAVFRAMYGGTFLNDDGESFDDFEARLLRIVDSRLS
jgi:AcrR family transcriptional regulator